MVALLYMKKIFVITEIVCITTGTSSALKNNRLIKRVPAAYSVAPWTQFGSVNRVGPGSGGVTPLTRHLVSSEGVIFFFL